MLPFQEPKKKKKKCRLSIFLDLLKPKQHPFFVSLFFFFSLNEISFFLSNNFLFLSLKNKIIL